MNARSVLLISTVTLFTIATTVHGLSSATTVAPNALVSSTSMKPPTSSEKPNIPTTTVNSGELEAVKTRLAMVEKDLTELQKTVVLSTCVVPADVSTALGVNGSLVAYSNGGSDKIVLKCAAPPVIIARPKSGTLAINEGNSLTLSCIPLGYPKPTLTWVTPQQEDISNTGTGIFVQNARNYHSGKYTCHADNKVGEPVNFSFSVDVLHKPKIHVTENVIYSGKGKTVTLTCHVEANPTPTVNWFKDKTKQTFPSTTFQQLNRTSFTSTLTFKVLEHDLDLGRYSCIAENSLGTTSAHFDLRGVPPFDVSILSAEEVDLNRFKLTFASSSHTDLEQYKLRLKGEEDVFTMETSFKASMVPDMIKQRESFEVTLAPGKRYHLELSVKNEYGWSEKSRSFELNSTYVCGQTIYGPLSSSRYLLSHEQYGKYYVPFGYKCLTKFVNFGDLVLNVLQFNYGEGTVSNTTIAPTTNATHTNTTEANTKEWTASRDPSCTTDMCVQFGFGNVKEIITRPKYICAQQYSTYFLALSTLKGSSQGFKIKMSNTLLDPRNETSCY